MPFRFFLGGFKFEFKAPKKKSKWHTVLEHLIKQFLLLIILIKQFLISFRFFKFIFFCASPSILNAFQESQSFADSPSRKLTRLTTEVVHS